MWRALAVACLLGTGCAGAGTLDQPRRWDFQRDRLQRPATGFIVPAVPDGTPAGDWLVVEDPEAPSPSNVLRQLSTHRPPGHYSVIVADAPPVTDFRLRVHLRPDPGATAARARVERARRDQLLQERDRQRAAGTTLPPATHAELARLLAAHPRPDRPVPPPRVLGGGAVFRYRDVRNYYVVAWNPLAGRLRLDKLRRGTRTQLATAVVDLPPDETGWHVILVAARGPRIAVAFDDTPLIDFVDPDATFSRGRVGCWTRGDAATAFDDLEVEPLRPRAARAQHPAPAGGPAE